MKMALLPAILFPLVFNENYSSSVEHRILTGAPASCTCSANSDDLHFEQTLGVDDLISSDNARHHITLETVQIVSGSCVPDLLYYVGGTVTMASGVQFGVTASGRRMRHREMQDLGALVGRQQDSVEHHPPQVSGRFLVGWQSWYFPAPGQSAPVGWLYLGVWQRDGQSHIYQYYRHADDRYTGIEELSRVAGTIRSIQYLPSPHGNMGSIGLVLERQGQTQLVQLAWEHPPFALPEPDVF